MRRLLSVLAAAGVVVVSCVAAAPAMAAPADGGRLPVKPADTMPTASANR